MDYYTLLGLPKQTHDLETIRKAYKAARDMAQDVFGFGCVGFGCVGFGCGKGLNGWMIFFCSNCWEFRLLPVFSMKHKKI